MSRLTISSDDLSLDGLWVGSGMTVAGDGSEGEGWRQF